MLLTALPTAAVGQTVAQDSEPVTTVDKVMTPEDIKATGVATLTPSQRKALDAWLTSYTESVTKLAQSKMFELEARTEPTPTQSAPPLAPSVLAFDSTV